MAAGEGGGGGGIITTANKAEAYLYRFNAIHRGANRVAIVSNPAK